MVVISCTAGTGATIGAGADTTGAGADTTATGADTTAGADTTGAGAAGWCVSMVVE